MTNEHMGATYADAVIVALSFARESPMVFLLTVPLTVALCLVFVIVVMRVFVAGPTARLRSEFDSKRAASAPTPQPRLEL